MIDALPLLLGPEGYQISRSVRLRSSASAYLQRTNATTGTDPLKLTVSGWVKRGSTSELPLLGSSTGTAAFDFFGFWTGDILAFRIRNSSAVDLVRLESSAVFRDYSAWYHIVAAYDSANATSTERLKLYVNGVQLTAFGTATYPPLNQGFAGDFLTDMQIGRTNTNSSNQNYGDGYITEINFIDGQALTPSSFGEINPVTGVWSPKKYTGTYGTNGFYLNFSNNSAATAAAIGADYSGNGNNWTPNNISVTAGVTYDSMLDVPTQWADGGNGRGNYAVANPLKKPSTSTITDGNLTVAIGASGGEQPATFAVTSGKWYWEVSPTTAFSALGIILSTATPSASSIANGYHYYGNNGQFYTGASGVAYGATFTNGDVVGVALDLDSNQITFYKNNSSQGAKTITAGEYNPDFAGGASVTNYINFGQRPFTYTPPTGFKALNTLNLPTPTILKGNQYFDATLWTGDNTARNIVNSGAMQPDLVWVKSRSTAGTSHVLIDAVRGANLALQSDLTNAEATFASSVTAFNANGFSLGTSNQVNLSPRTYVGWQWKEGATQGFDIVTYTGTGANRTIAHNLGVAPSMIIVKARNLPNSIARSWAVWHSALSATEVIFLNQTSAKQTGATTYWNSTLPTSSVFSLGTEPTVNGATGTVGEYVAYLFAAVAGYSAFGSYTGNGSADGPFVFLGFRPRWILTKAASGATGSWWLYDTARSTYNEMTDLLRPDLSNADTTQGFCDALSNGFKIRNSGNNTNGATYIYMAFAENPFKNALAR